MKRSILIGVVALAALPGCGRHRQVVRPAPPELEAAANDPKPTPRINNGESQAVQNWSTGDR